MNANGYEERRLAAAMDRNNVKPGAMAQALGVSKETISRWRANVVIPTGENLNRALEYLRQFEPDLQAADLLPSPVEAGKES
jgi:transcriptional regulator with XRE-family HTH domain